MNKVYFVQLSTGNRITAGNDDKSAKARQYFVRKCQESLSLKRVLLLAGAKVINSKPEEESEIEYVDFTPQNLSKDSILNLMVEKKEEKVEK